MTVTEVAEGVYDITCAETIVGRIRAYLFDDETPTLVDTNREPEPLLSGIDEVGVEPERVVLTHGHPNCVGSVDAVAERYGVEIWAPHGTDLRADATADHRYGDGERIGRFTTVHVPGHAPDNSVLVHDDGVAVLGDSVVGADRRGLPAGYFVLPEAVVSDDLNEAEESLKAVCEFDFDVGLVFHGSNVTEDASEVLDGYVNPPMPEGV